jgi:putative hemolysin
VPGRPHKRCWGVLGLAALLLIASPESSHAQIPVANPPKVEFENVAASAGLNVSHISTPGKQSIIESMSGGVGFNDCDNDGKLDIVTVNGSTVDCFRQGGDLMVTKQETSCVRVICGISGRSDEPHADPGLVRPLNR